MKIPTDIERVKKNTCWNKDDIPAGIHVLSFYFDVHSSIRGDKLAKESCTWKNGSGEKKSLFGNLLQVDT